MSVFSNHHQNSRLISLFCFYQFVVVAIICGNHVGTFRFIVASDSSSQEKKNLRVDNDNNDQKRVLTFINFSGDDDVQISWVGPDQTRYPKVNAAPYETYKTTTFVGHVFAYKVSNGTEILYEVPKANNNKNGDEIVHIIDYRPEKIDTKHVVCGTTKGDIRIVVKPLWSPYGAARFLEILDNSVRYFNRCALNRNVPKFLVQFGIGANYELRTKYRQSRIPDDPQWSPPIKFQPGYMSYAGSGPNSRSTEMFIARPDAPRSQLDYFGVNAWETPFGYVEEQYLDVVTKWYSGYGDMGPKYGKGPNPQMIYKEDGYHYLETEFPNLDYITGCVIVPDNFNETDWVQSSYAELEERIFVDDDALEEL